MRVHGICIGSRQKKRYFYELAPRFLPTNAITIRYGVIQDVGRRPHLETMLGGKKTQDLDPR